MWALPLTSFVTLVESLWSCIHLGAHLACLRAAVKIKTLCCSISNGNVLVLLGGRFTDTHFSTCFIDSYQYCLAQCGAFGSGVSHPGLMGHVGPGWLWVWPKTALLLSMWPRDVKRLGTPVRLLLCFSYKNKQKEVTVSALQELCCQWLVLLKWMQSTLCPST